MSKPPAKRKTSDSNLDDAVAGRSELLASLDLSNSKTTPKTIATALLSLLPDGASRQHPAAEKIAKAFPLVIAELDARAEGPGLQILHEEDESPNLFALYSGDLGEIMLSYASASELCKFDALNKQFQGLTANAWAKLTNKRFGMKDGKDGWRMGLSLLREPVFIHISEDPVHGNMYYAGSPKVTTHNDLVVLDSDDADPDYGAPDGIGLYNAQTLDYLGPRGEGGWETTAAGPAGDELFASHYNCHHLVLTRGGNTKRQTFPNNRNRDGIPLIASETHVIILIGNTVNLHKIVSDSNLVNLCQSTLLGRDCRHADEHFRNSITWGADQSEFVVYHSLENFNDEIPGTCEISIWSFNVEEDSISRNFTIEAGIKLNDVELAEDFIIGSCERKKIHVWDRHTKEKKPYVLCDVEEDDELHEMDIIHSLRMSCNGHMLVTSSYFGCALCVWNIKTGQLVKRYNDAHEERFVDMIDDGGCDVTSMAYLKTLNGYICVDGYLNIWTFPTNQSQNDTAMMIRNREEDRRRNA